MRRGLCPERHGGAAGTRSCVKIAAQQRRPDTQNMGAARKYPGNNPRKRSAIGANWRGAVWAAALGVAAFCGIAGWAEADEIRLKDGKKLYGVIVAYEDNMFKVKTDFGYVLVEKDKISSIIPATPAAGAEKEPRKAQPAKKEPPAKSNGAPEAETAAASETEAPPAAKEASVKPASAAAKSEKAPPRIGNTAVRPSLPANSAPANATPPAIKANPPGANAAEASGIAANTPKEPEVPANREEVQGNSYTNFTHGFRMYKAPSWEMLDDARSALPNAIVAMGTQDESTLLVIGQEKTKEALEPAAKTVERRLHEVYENYRLISQKKTTVSGLAAMEYRYRGVADGHDWSGTLLVVARGSETFTALGMTYADTDLIQIQENVIARAIGSLDFNVK